MNDLQKIEEISKPLITDVIAINRQGIVQQYQVKQDYSKYCIDIPACYYVDKISDEDKKKLPFLSFDGVLEQLPPKTRKEVKFDYDGKEWIEENISKLKSLNTDPEKYTKLKNQILKKIQFYELNESWVNKFVNDIAQTSLVETSPESVKKEIEFKQATKTDNKFVEDKEEIKKTSLFIDERFMHEQVKTKEGNFFIKFEFATNKWERTDCVEGAEPLYPIDDEEVMAGHIRLPDDVCDYITEEQLITDIEKHVKKYLDVPEDYLHYASLNILKSWVYERYRSLNYLRVQGEPGTGKSRFLDVIGGLHYKPIATSGASTVSPIFRLINKWGCTLIMDEADLRESDETNDLIKIINQGFEKDRPVIRCNPDDKSKVEFFNVYCPKVLSTRREFEDIATESRCMTQIMTGTRRSDIISSLDDSFYAEQQTLRNKMLLWRFKNFNRIEPNIGETYDWAGIEPRLKQTNVGFLSLIHQDKAYVDKFMKRIKEKQESLQNERSETYEGHIINACSRLILEDKPIIAQSIINYADLTDAKGNKWKPRRIASYMKTMGFDGTKLERQPEGKPEKVYQYKPEVICTLFQKYMTKDEFQDFDKELRKKQGMIKSTNHDPYFVYHVTVVTVIYEQGKTVTNDNKAEIVTNAVAHHKDGYIGYTVTEKLQSFVSDGALIRNADGSYKEVK